ncbi:MAG: ABC transporter ATP-binding protein [Patescibacteria group bacterium]
MALIETRGLEKTYYTDEVATPVLRDVSLDIKAGEFVAIMGPSGSGKSTLLHLLGFLDRPTAGHFRFDGKEMDDYSDDDLAKIRNEKIGFIFQSFNLLPRTTVLDNVKLPLYYSTFPESSWQERALKAIEAVGLSHRLDHEPAKLSGGEKQRVAIARALVTDPAVIFADEPTGNLDSQSGGQVMSAIEALHDSGRTIILITHETYTAEYAERVIRLRDGAIESDERMTSRRRHDQFKK